MHITDSTDVIAGILHWFYTIKHKPNDQCTCTEEELAAHHTAAVEVLKAGREAWNILWTAELAKHPEWAQYSIYDPAADEQSDDTEPSPCQCDACKLQIPF